jgi:hypothetical protein
LREQGFQAKYDEVVSDFLARIAAGNDIKTVETWDAEKSAKLVSDLSEQFRAYFQTQVVSYKTIAQEASENRVIWGGADTLLHSTHLTGLSTLVAVYEIGKSYVGWVRNIRKAVGMRDPTIAKQEAHRRRSLELEAFLEALKPSNKPTILTALRELRRIAASHISPN